MLVRCPKLDLERSAAQPFDLVHLDLRPGKKLADLAVQLVVDDATVDVGLQEQADERVFVIVPLHPEGMDGGAGTLEFSYKGKTCESVEIDIEPLPEAAGTSQKMLDTLGEILDASVAAYALPAELDLVDAVEVVDDEVVVDLPPRAFHVGFLQYLVDHPDNESALVQVVDEMDEESLRDLDAVLTKLGVVEWLEFERDSLLSEELSFLPAASLPSAQAVDVDKPAISTCPQLLATIWSGRRACNVGRSQLLGDDRLVAGQVQGLMASSFGELASAAAQGTSEKISQGAKPFVAGALATAGALAVWSKYRCATLPESAGGFRLDDASLRIPEDRPEFTGVSGVWIAAESGPPTSLAASAVDLASAGLGVAGALVPGGGIKEFVGDELQGFARRGVSMAFQESETAMIGGWSWPKIDVDHPRCTGIGVSSGQIVKDGLCRSKLCLEQLDVGQTPVAFYKKVAYDTPSRFSSVDALPPPFEYEEIPVHVLEIRVHLGPFVRFVDEGEVVQIDYRVENADDPLLQWSAQGRVFTTNKERGTVTVTAPTDPAEFPSEVEALAESTSGLRQPSKRKGERRGVTTLDVGELLVLPRATCVLPGTAVTFEAYAKNQPEAEISWEPNALISSDGVFVAPMMHDHTFTVSATAEYPDEESVTEEVEVRVSTKCRCWYSVWTYGDLSVSHVQDWGIEAMPLGGRTAGFPLVLMLTRPDGFKVAEVVIERTADEFSTGFHSGSVMMNPEGGGDPFLTLGPDVIHLVREDDRHILGRVTGMMAGINEQWAMLDLQFRFVDDANLLVSDTCYDEASYERAQTRGDGKILDLFRGE